MARTTESVFGKAILRILAERPDGSATIRAIKAEIPNRINLTPSDRAPSQTRKGEELWQQSVRNIVSHRKNTPGNIVFEGYAVHSPRTLTITEAGRTHIAPS